MKGKVNLKAKREAQSVTSNIIRETKMKKRFTMLLLIALLGGCTLGENLQMTKPLIGITVRNIACEVKRSGDTVLQRLT